MNTSCCQSSYSTPHPTKLRCPVSGLECSRVSTRTILHHIEEAWAWSPSAANYYYCDDPQCDVVYFGDDGTTILRSQLRTHIGAKEDSADSLLCYCFGVTKSDYQRDPATKDFVTAQTAAGLCSCETSNPSGRCCLKDFANMAEHLPKQCCATNPGTSGGQRKPRTQPRHEGIC